MKTRTRDRKWHREPVNERPFGAGTPTNPKDCPRCGGWIPSDDRPGAHGGALSRRFIRATDSEVEVCSRCGLAEAIGDDDAETMMPRRKVLAS